MGREALTRFVQQIATPTAGAPARAQILDPPEEVSQTTFSRRHRLHRRTASRRDVLCEPGGLVRVEQHKGMGWNLVWRGEAGSGRFRLLRSQLKGDPR